MVPSKFKNVFFSFAGYPAIAFAYLFFESLMGLKD